MANLDKLLDKAQAHLEEGEHVLEAVQGAYETKIMGNETVRTGIFAATDRRLVFYAKKMTGYDLEVFPYENISSIEMGKNMMGHHIKFFASGNTATMKWIKKGDVAKFVQTVKSRMGKQSAPAAHTADQPDLATQIRQLAGLRDEGLLTDEEFQAKKTQLLG